MRFLFVTTQILFTFIHIETVPPLPVDRSVFPALIQFLLSGVSVFDFSACSLLFSPEASFTFSLCFFLIEEIITICERCPFDRAYEGRGKKPSSALWAVFQDMTFMLTFLCYEGLISESKIHCSPLTKRLKDFLFCEIVLISSHGVTAHCLSPLVISPSHLTNAVRITWCLPPLSRLQQAADFLIHSWTQVQRSWVILHQMNILSSVHCCWNFH